MRRFGLVLAVLVPFVMLRPAAAQCRQADRPITFQLPISAAPSVAQVTKRIDLCTRHEYRLALDAGQYIELRLASPSGQAGMLTLVAPSGSRLVDGESSWAGVVNERGTYVIEIGTDRTTAYTLNVVLR
jgi:hypothetical protein